MIPLLGNWYANAAHVFLFNFAFKFAKLGGLNQGVVSVTTTFASIFNTVIFYFYFGERVGMPQYFGIALIFCCGVLLGIAASMKKKDANTELSEGDISQVAYSFYALACAIMVPVNFSFKHFLIRKYKGSYKTFDLAFDSNILENLTFSILTVVYYD